MNEVRAYLVECRVPASFLAAFDNLPEDKKTAYDFLKFLIDNSLGFHILLSLFVAEDFLMELAWKILEDYKNSTGNALDQRLVSLTRNNLSTAIEEITLIEPSYSYFQAINYYKEFSNLEHKIFKLKTFNKIFFSLLKNNVIFSEPVAQKQYFTNLLEFSKTRFELIA